MYQHVQFRRVEKFIKNYQDCGQLISQKMAQNSDKLLQDVKFIDGSHFYGEAYLDEET